MSALPEGVPLHFDTIIDGYEVSLDILADKFSHGTHNGNPINLLRTVGIQVTHNEDNYPSNNDYWRVADRYSDAAMIATNRIIDYFKYVLRTPNLKYVRRFDASLSNTSLIDSNGNPIYRGSRGFGTPITGLHGEQEVTKLTSEHLQDLSNVISGGGKFQLLYEELLADAQTAIYEGSTRRAVLELAIGCEVLVKRIFFSRDTPAGAAFDFLEDKAKIKLQ